MKIILAKKISSATYSDSPNEKGNEMDTALIITGMLASFVLGAYIRKPFPLSVKEIKVEKPISIMDKKDSDLTPTEKLEKNRLIQIDNMMMFNPGQKGAEIE